MHEELRDSQYQANVKAFEKRLASHVLIADEVICKYQETEVMCAV